MTFCVLDSSIALAWVLPDEQSDRVEDLLEKVITAGAAAPSLWVLETANTLLMVYRRGRLSLAQRHQAKETLAALPIDFTSIDARQAWNDIFDLASAHALTVYDASYLALALRRGLPLASLDQALLRAAEACGVATLGG